MSSHSHLYGTCFIMFLLLSKLAFAQLSSNHYDNTCPKALSTIKSIVHNAVGCDASVLLDDTSSFTGEKSANANANSIRGFESLCPGVVSCADILAVAARDSVVAIFIFVLFGGPSWTVQLGRRDSTTASSSAVNTNIPSPLMDLNDLISNFAKKGFSAKEMVALSGAHTIGQARCLLFRERIYNETNIDSEFATSLKSNCPSSGGDDNLSQLDATSSVLFDNGYFQDLVNNKVTTYSTIIGTFYADFANAMVKMGNLSPLTGTDGQICTNCRKIN
ncbi:peroxidase [Citrus sinensis]|nr:peroxidase [Citrus sinensis]